MLLHCKHKLLVLMTLDTNKLKRSLNLRSHDSALNVCEGINNYKIMKSSLNFLNASTLKCNCNEYLIRCYDDCWFVVVHYDCEVICGSFFLGCLTWNWSHLCKLTTVLLQPLCGWNSQSLFYSVLGVECAHWTPGFHNAGFARCNHTFTSHGCQPTTTSIDQK